MVRVRSYSRFLKRTSTPLSLACTSTRSWKDRATVRRFLLGEFGLASTGGLYTVNIKGKFGIAIETHDEINDLLIFDFGVYNIDLIIDDELIYSITFDKYNFIENPLIYTEIDYSLLQKNIIAHRLFNKENILPFIKKDDSGTTSKMNYLCYKIIFLYSNST